MLSKQKKTKGRGTLSARVSRKRGQPRLSALGDVYREAARRLVVGESGENCCCWAIHFAEGKYSYGMLADYTRAQVEFRRLFAPDVRPCEYVGAFWYGSTCDKRNLGPRQNALLFAAAMADTGDL